MKTVSNNKILTFFLCVCISLFEFATAQTTQTVRGTVYDQISKSPLAGAKIVITNTNPNLGSISNENGQFKINSVPIGRISLTVSYIGYEEIRLNELVLNAGKELLLNLEMTEKVVSVGEVEIIYKRSEDKTVTNNEFATVSSRAFNASEANRYAGSLGDPSRMAANFAGVSGANDARNDIIVRGNSPASLLWRLNGVNIPNPNHFGALGTTGGPVSMINNNLLAKSDFMTGAFPSEYANALGAVFDLKFRKGNDEKFEFLGQIGFNGFEGLIEGPISRKHKSSFFVNYRYSTLSVFQKLGVNFITGSATPIYSDFTAKADFPVGKKGNLSMWTVGGNSNIEFLGKEVDTTLTDLYGDENSNIRVKYHTYIGALSYEHRFNDKTFGKIIFSGSTTYNYFDNDTISYITKEEIPYIKGDYTQNKYSMVASIAHKFSAKSNISVGFIGDILAFSLTDKVLYPNPFFRRNSDGNTILGQGYIQWKYRFNPRLTLNTGINASGLAINSSTVVEPRIGLKYALTTKSSISAAYGLHSQMQPILTYSYEETNANGITTQRNKNLGFTKSHHYVLAYDLNFNENLRLKAEAYYQSIFNAPVDTFPSYFSMLTQGTDFAPTNRGGLVNNGTGENYGIELTLEKFFSNNYYFLSTLSLFNSTYKGSDDIIRNTPFNSKYVYNLLAGKDFKVGKKNNVLSINLRTTTAGGKYIIPIDLEQSRLTNQTVYDYSKAFLVQNPAYFRTDIKIGFKMQRKRSTHEYAVDFQNIFNTKNLFLENYNQRTGEIGKSYQQGFFPVPFYRLTF